MQTIMGAIDQLFANLRADNKNSNVRPAFVERLLDFYWQVIKRVFLIFKILL